LTREALADRLVNYSDAAAAFSIVNAFGFLLALAETEIRCSLVSQASLVYAGQLLTGFVLTAVVVALRRLELSLRSPVTGGDPTVRRVLHAFFVVRISVVWVVVLLTLVFMRLAFSDPGCAPPAA